MPAQGATASVTVTTSAGCAWESVSNDPWLTIVAGASGSGSGSVQFAAAANASQSTRSGTLTIAGQTFTVTQAGVPAPPTCTFTVAPATAAAPVGGGPGSVTVTASDASCPWTAASGAAWLTITSGAGPGNGVVQYTVAANPGPEGRSVTLTVAGQTVVVNQAGPPAVVSVTGVVAGLQGECPVITFTVGTRLVRTDASTQFQSGCNSVRNGRTFAAEGSIQLDGSLLARLVRREN